MRGKVFRLFDKGRRLDSPSGILVAEGDFNFQEGPHPVTGRLDRSAVITSSGKGVVARMHRAEVIAIAGFGIAIAGLESTRIGRESISVEQEWWFVPSGHEDESASA